MKDSEYQKKVDALVELTERALKFVEKRDLSRAFLISDKRKRLLNKFKFEFPAEDEFDKVVKDLKNVQVIDASIKKIIEAELTVLLNRVGTIKKSVQMKNRFVGARRIPRKIIDGKM